VVLVLKLNKKEAPKSHTNVWLFGALINLKLFLQ